MLWTNPQAGQELRVESWCRAEFLSHLSSRRRWPSCRDTSWRNSVARSYETQASGWGSLGEALSDGVMCSNCDLKGERFGGE